VYVAYTSQAGGNGMQVTRRQQVGAHAPERPQAAPTSEETAAQYARTGRAPRRVAVHRLSGHEDTDVRSVLVRTTTTDHLFCTTGADGPLASAATMLQQEGRLEETWRILRALLPDLPVGLIADVLGLTPTPSTAD
jgi:hypothetical protein